MDSGLSGAGAGEAREEPLLLVGERPGRERALDQVVVISPILERVTYVAESAVGPGCDIDFSADGGQTFGRPSELTVKLPAGQSRTATAADYTHIRWKLRYALSGTSTAFARFSAVLK